MLTPPSRLQFNRVERVFTISGEQHCERGAHRSIAELEVHIKREFET
ncbi:MAG: hypothetical protein OXI57_04460 [Rhodospirillales bacterium]|nr:hypothetical protein [Rhodospirillales bacterium]